MKTIVRLYDDVSIARDAIQELLAAGFDRQDITLLAYDPYGDYSSYLDRSEMPGDIGEETAAGAGIGALVGGIGGLLLGLGALTITGIGPIVAAGPIAAALLGAGTGATVGGLVGLLMEADLDEEQAQLYAEGVRRGGTLVVVKADDRDAQRAELVLERLGPVDVLERAAGWRARGWSGYKAEEEPYPPDEVELEQNFYTFEPVYRRHYEQSLAAEGNPYWHYEPAYYYGYDLVARRGYYDRDWEEIEPEIRQDWESRGQGPWDQFGSAVRYAWDEARQAVDMGDEMYYEDYEDWQPEFREHYDENYASSGRSYLDYDFAYRYGYDLALDERYEGQEWDELEPEARGEWERRGGGPWDDFRQAVQHAWSEVRDAYDFEDDYGYFEEDFRRHYQANYGTSGHTLDEYDTAYRYGYDLANSDFYRDRQWDEIEPEIRRNWESQTDSPWDEFKSAVQHAWSQVTRAFSGEETRERTSVIGNGCRSRDAEFRRHYQSVYGTTGYPYTRYETAYYYGCELASDERYRGRSWDEIESGAQRDWQMRSEGPWEEFRDAVRHAWREVTGGSDPGARGQDLYRS